MRARSIKPGLFKNELLGAADPLFTVIFEGLWCLADREGRLEDRPLRIHVEINPYRDSASTVQALDWLVSNQFVTRYEVDGAKYLEIANFTKHQQPHIKEAASKIPLKQNQEVVSAPDKHRASTGVAALTPSSLTPDSGLPTADSGLRVTRIGDRQGVPRETFDKIRSLYPPGIYREADWLLAEREIGFRLGEGESLPDLVSAAAAYGLQQQTLGKVGTQFVLKPSRFFGSGGEWRGPFPTPAKAETASEAILRKNGGRNTTTVIEHGFAEPAAG